MQSIISLLLTAKLLQSCSTLCDPRDGSLPGSLIPGILQARTLEWVAISFSSAWMWKVKGKSLSHVRLLATPGTAAYQAPPSMGFSRQEYWSGLPLPSQKVTIYISCVSTSNLPCFMYLTFQAPMLYCSLQHWTFLSPADTITPGCCFHFGSASSSFL